MLVRHALLIATLLLLTACSQLNTVTQETMEAGENLKNKAVEIQEGVTNTVDQVNKAKDSVVDAAGAVGQAVEDLKAIGN
jgi:hypothetical protein